MKDYYKILSIEKDADQILIKKAFKKLVKEFHPDLSKSSNTNTRFFEVKEAYEVLSDRFKRIQYNNLYNSQIAIALKKEKTNRKFLLQSLITKNNALAFSIFAFLLIAFSFYFNKIKNTKKEELLLIKSKIEKENIDLNSNTYFKNIEEEVTDEELQDFTIYKDVSDVVINTNSKNIKTKKTISLQKIQVVNSSVQQENIQLTNVNSELPLSKNPITKVNTENSIKNTANLQKEELVVDKNEIVKSKPFELYKKREPNKNSNETRVTVNNLNIISLQHIKGNKYVKPKKIKKLNALKISVILNKPKQTDNNSIDVMLVVKNTTGTTLIIDVKEVDFNNTETRSVIFYEKFKDKLVLGQEYTFSFFANKRLIKTSLKRI